MSVESTIARMIEPFDRPWHWIAVGLAFLGLDMLTGPLTQFPITFVVPVSFAAWHRGLAWALSLSVLLPLGRLAIAVLEQPSDSAPIALVNMLVRIGVLAFMAVLVDSMSRHVRELRKEVLALSGLLPICSFCKKIRDQNESWLRLEQFISERSEASFTHSLCPECEALHYPDDESG